MFKGFKEIGLVYAKRAIGGCIVQQIVKLKAGLINSFACLSLNF